MASLPEPCGQLARGSGLSRALQPGHQNDRRRLGREVEPGRILAQQRDQLIPDDLDHLLGRRKVGQHFLADCLFADVLDQFLDDIEVDVRLKQGDANLAQCLADVFVRDGALTPQVLESSLKLIR